MKSSTIFCPAFLSDLAMVVCRRVMVLILLLSGMTVRAVDTVPVTPAGFSDQDRKFCRDNNIPDSAWESLSLWPGWRLQVYKTDPRALPLRSESDGDALHFVTASADALIYANQIKPDTIGAGRCIVRAEFRTESSGQLRFGYYSYDVAGRYRGKKETVIPVAAGPVQTATLEVDRAELAFIQSIRPFFAVGGDVALLSVATVEDTETDANQSLVRSEVLDVSAPTITIEDAPYPDCMLTARVKIVSIQQGAAVPREILLVYPWFLNRQATRYAGIRRGDRLLLRLQPFDESDSVFKSFQQADTIADYELEPYLLEGMAVLTDPPEPESGLNFKDDGDYVSIYQRHVNLPLTEEAVRLRAEAIRNESNLVHARLDWVSRLNSARINQEFLDAWNKRRNSLESIDGKLAWGQVNGSYFALPFDHKLLPAASYRPDPEQIAALRSINEFLLANGVEFIVQLIPQYYDVAARVFNPEFAGIPDARMLQLARTLLENNIETMYTFDAFVRKPFGHELLFLYPKDAHPGDGAQELLTDLMAARLGRFGLATDDVDPRDFSSKPGRCRYDWNVWPEGVNIGSHQPGTRVEVEHILYRNRPLEFPADSPVFVVGNSFIQSPMEDGAYSARLASKIRRLPSNWYVTSLGPQTTIFPAFARKPEFFLKGRKVVVLPIAVHQICEFPNLRQYDRIRSRLAEWKEREELPLDAVPVVTEAPETLPRSVEWKKFLDDHSARMVSVRKNQPVVLADVPVERPARAVLVRVCAHPRHQLSLSVNGETQPVPRTEDASFFAEMLFELPEGTDHLRITAETGAAAAGLGVESITLLR